MLLFELGSRCTPAQLGVPGPGEDEAVQQPVLVLTVDDRVGHLAVGIDLLAELTERGLVESLAVRKTASSLAVGHRN